MLQLVPRLVRQRDDGLTTSHPATAEELERIRTHAAARRLLTQTNLRQLTQFVASKDDRRALNAFLERLPA